MAANGTLPYWNVNVPAEQRTAECPDFLVELNEKDVGIVSTPDSEYHVFSWAQVCETAKANRLDLFQRVPSDLRRYKAFTYKLAKDYGSVGNFILNKRLGWDSPVKPRGRPFEFDEDVKILWNDWPYGIDAKIVHLVVWTKFELEEDPTTGDLTDQARSEVEAYVNRTFRSHVPADRVTRSLFSRHVANLTSGRSFGSRTGGV